MNDPNGLLYHKGVYHFFYQHNPHGLEWAATHWGHATSTDLVHWTQKPIALEPGVHPGDLWSGTGVVGTANTSGLRTGTEDPFVVFAGTSGVTMFYQRRGPDLPVLRRRNAGGEARGHEPGRQGVPRRGPRPVGDGRVVRRGRERLQLTRPP
jgi:hypothetical protein